MKKDDGRQVKKRKPPRDGFIGTIDSIADLARDLPWGIGGGLADALDNATGRDQQ